MLMFKYFSILRGNYSTTEIHSTLEKRIAWIKFILRFYIDNKLNCLIFVWNNSIKIYIKAHSSFSKRTYFIGKTTNNCTSCIGLNRNIRYITPETSS